jgi:RNA polymerase sigma-70 factor (ECF subfamily)
VTSFSFAIPLAAFPAPAERAERGVDAAEHEWIRASRGGDTEAFRRLVDRYRADVVELCVRIVRSREEGEEAAQDSFVRAWRALPKFREEARFSTWLFRIATRRALDSAETLRRRRERETTGDPALLDAAPDGGSAVSGAAQRKLWRALGGLEPVPRAVVALHYWGRHAVAEISEMLEMPEGTVKTHLHRSRAALRAAWIRESRKEARRELPSL